MSGVYRTGDVVEFDFSPSVGHEPMGRMPGLVVSCFDFNAATSMALVCPIISRDNGFPLHLRLPDLDECQGCVVLEQVRCFDLASRNARVLAHLDEGGEFMVNVQSVMRSFF